MNASTALSKQDPGVKPEGDDHRRVMAKQDPGAVLETAAPGPEQLAVC